MELSQQAQFASQLKEVRTAAGNPSLARLAACDPRVPSTSSLSSMLRGEFKRVPPWEGISAFLKACRKLGSDEDGNLPPHLTDLSDLETWRRHHEVLTRLLTSLNSISRQHAVASTAQSATAVDQAVSMLYARYGNTCVYPGCTEKLIISRADHSRFHGKTIDVDPFKSTSNLKKIAGASNSEIADANTIITCEAHHEEITNDPDKWTAARLLEIRSSALERHTPGFRRQLPRLITVHYANCSRLRDVALYHELDIPVPNEMPDKRATNLPWLHRVMKALSTVELNTRRLTKDFDLRALTPGDLLVFDRAFFTLHGPPMNSSRNVLTGDLNRDPVVHFKRRGVRLLMQLDPDWITTSTAYNDFSAGTVKLAGLCVIKRRVPPGAISALKKADVEIMASPLILGISPSFGGDKDLNERTVQDGWDSETGEQVWLGPWNSPTEDDEPQYPENSPSTPTSKIDHRTHRAK